MALDQDGNQGQSRPIKPNQGDIFSTPLVQVFGDNRRDRHARTFLPPGTAALLVRALRRPFPVELSPQLAFRCGTLSKRVKPRQPLFLKTSSQFVMIREIRVSPFLPDPNKSC